MYIGEILFASIAD